jgi:hypothetical protein
MAKKFWITRTVVGHECKILIEERTRSPKAAIFGPFDTFDEASDHLKDYMQRLMQLIKSRPE